MHASFSLEEFLKRRADFSLGNLTTENFHPLTKNLSREANSDLKKSLLTLQKVDALALERLCNYSDKIFEFQKVCQKTLSSGGRIFISGCGATGRLALSIEKIANEQGLKNKVFGFMAGGDFALIKSVESFEDRADFGVKQLKELGFTQDDLLVGVTEGGETSFVLGTIAYAKEFSNIKPFFLYCNPDAELENIERSNSLIKDDMVEKVNLTVGEMALSGSTRMQATTVQMLACGCAIFNAHKTPSECLNYLKKMSSDLLNFDILSLEPFIKAESDHYNSGGVVTYVASSEIAIAVMTDTTERSPTFNLPGFEKEGEEALSMAYLCVKDTFNSESAWESLLSRSPKAIDWEETAGKINLTEVYSFNISEDSITRREKQLQAETFSIISHDDSIDLEFKGLKKNVKLSSRNLLFKHLLLKVILNIHSTLIMGRLGRYEDNMMTYVRASNLKLIDRAIRYAKQLLLKNGIQPDDTEMAKFIFEHKHEDGPIVLKLRDYYLKRI